MSNCMLCNPPGRKVLEGYICGQHKDQRLREGFYKVTPNQLVGPFALNEAKKTPPAQAPVKQPPAGNPTAPAPAPAAPAAGAAENPVAGAAENPVAGAAENPAAPPAGNLAATKPAKKSKNWIQKWWANRKRRKNAAARKAGASGGNNMPDKKGQGYTFTYSDPGPYGSNTSYRERWRDPYGYYDSAHRDGTEKATGQVGGQAGQQQQAAQEPVAQQPAAPPAAQQPAAPPAAQQPAAPPAAQAPQNPQAAQAPQNPQAAQPGVQRAQIEFKKRIEDMEANEKANIKYAQQMASLAVGEFNRLNRAGVTPDPELVKRLHAFQGRHPKQSRSRKQPVSEQISNMDNMNEMSESLDRLFKKYSSN